ncbi:MAG TPA: hypothetical protein DDW52_11695 [Planctomycetaceae bacterium]|nr:hypothetical protein [Planctomycetaceae bacterium]
MLRGEQIERAAPIPVRYVLVVSGLLAVTIACIAAMETMGSFERVTGPVFSVLWCLGLALWCLRAIRSHQSKFAVGTVLCITTILAVGLSSFAGRFVVLAIAGLAMIFDLRVKQGANDARLEVLSRTIQVMAGVTCIAHASRVTYHVLIADP